MSATAADYSWWSEWRPDWAKAYCVTLVSDTTAQGVLTSLGATQTRVVSGFDALYERAVEDWPDSYDQSGAPIGVAGLSGGWVLIAEVNGFVGVTERLMGPLSPGRTIVSHFRNINAVSRFHWWRDGQLLLDFDPLFPTDRFGGDPDAIVDVIHAVGFPLDEDGAIDEIDCSAAAFALAERITDVRTTTALLESRDFTVATVEVPDLEEQQRYGERLRTLWRTPIAW